MYFSFSQASAVTGKDASRAKRMFVLPTKTAHLLPIWPQFLSLEVGEVGLTCNYHLKVLYHIQGKDC